MRYVSFKCKYDSSDINNKFTEPTNLKLHKDIKSVFDGVSTDVEDVRNVRVDIIRYLGNEGYINYSRTTGKYITFCLDLKYHGDNEMYFELLNLYQTLLREDKIDSILEE